MEKCVMTPDDRKYSKSHEWIKIEGDLAVIGITDHAQKALGDITFVDMPETGKKLEKEKEFGVIESVKAASDLYSPVAGEVAEVNSALDDKPEIVNEDPYGNGWIIKIRGFNADELETLLDAQGYEATLG